jgi:hypothetical protein
MSPVTCFVLKVGFYNVDGPAGFLQKRRVWPLHVAVLRFASAVLICSGRFVRPCQCLCSSTPGLVQTCLRMVLLSDGTGTRRYGLFTLPRVNLCCLFSEHLFLNYCGTRHVPLPWKRLKTLTEEIYIAFVCLCETTPGQRISY